MGRTVRTFRDAVDIDEARWKDFKRTLRPSQRERLSRVFDYARKCADAGTMVATPRITEVVMLSAIVEMLGELDDIREEIFHLKEMIEATIP